MRNLISCGLRGTALDKLGINSEYDSCPVILYTRISVRFRQVGMGCMLCCVMGMLGAPRVQAQASDMAADWVPAVWCKLSVHPAACETLPGCAITEYFAGVVNVCYVCSRSVIVVCGDRRFAANLS